MSGTTNYSVRLKILEILYNKATEGTDWAVEREEMKRLLPISENQLDFNMLYLNDKKLANIRKLDPGNWHTTNITGKGIDVIENKQQFARELPFIQVAIQEIGGKVYGSAVQAVQSEVVSNLQETNKFEQAYEQVRKALISPDKKEEINANLKALEKELLKEKPNKNKIDAIWEWLKGNADWIVPAIAEIVTKALTSASPKP